MSSPQVAPSGNEFIASPQNAAVPSEEFYRPQESLETLVTPESGAQTRQVLQDDLQLVCSPPRTEPSPPKLLIENDEPIATVSFAHASPGSPSILPAPARSSNLLLSTHSSNLTSPAQQLPLRTALRSGQLSPVNLNIRPALPRTPNIVLCPDSDEPSPSEALPQSILAPPPTTKPRLRPLESFIPGFYKTARSASQAARPKTATGASQGRRMRATQRRPATAAINSYGTSGMDVENSLRSTAEGFGFAEQEDEHNEREAWLKDGLGGQDIANFILTNDGHVALR